VSGLDPEAIAARVRRIRALLADSMMEAREGNPDRARCSAAAADKAAGGLLADLDAVARLSRPSHDAGGRTVHINGREVARAVARQVRDARS
jgi:hypothetical protein